MSMYPLQGVNVQKLDSAISEIGRVETVNPARVKMPVERVDDRIPGERGQDNVGSRKIDFERMSEQDKQKLQDELDKHNEKFAYTGKYLKFKFDEEASTMYVEVIDLSTQEVIVSLPPEFLIDLSVKMKKIFGLYIDEKL